MTIDDLANRVSAWILAEAAPRRKMAYIIANVDDTSTRLQDFLLTLIDLEDTPGTIQLKKYLGEEWLVVLERRGLPWTNIWSFVGVDLCTTVGLELKVGEFADLRTGLSALPPEVTP